MGGRIYSKFQDNNSLHLQTIKKAVSFLILKVNKQKICFSFRKSWALGSKTIKLKTLCEIINI